MRGRGCRVDKKEFRIDYCPTGDMIADYFTKPLQGTLFNKFRAVIMGWEHIDTISSAGNKERVAKQVFPDDHMNAANAIKKSYADAVKNDHCRTVHIDSFARHLLQNHGESQ